MDVRMLLKLQPLERVAVVQHLLSTQTKLKHIQPLAYDKKTVWFDAFTELSDRKVTVKVVQNDLVYDIFVRYEDRGDWIHAGHLKLK